MTQPKKAAFSFKTFKVPSFSYEASELNNIELNLMFNPSGKYNKKTGRYYLTIEFTGFEDEKKSNPAIKVKGVAEFKFSEALSLEDIPPFFYTNSIPIVFPYLRAFISNLTLQANTGVIMLGLLNFTGMHEILKKQTKLINE